MPSPTKSSGALKYELLLLLASIIWGGAFPAQQIGMEKGLGPMTFNGLRFALGCLALLPLLYWLHRRPAATASANRPLPLRGCLIAGLFLFAAASFQQIGLQYTSSANAGFITSFYILFVPLIGITLRQRTTRSLWLGIAICLTGFYLLSVTATFTIGKGDLLVLMSALLWAGQILMIDRLANKGDAIPIALVQFTVCAALSLIVGAILETTTLAAIRAAAGAVAYAGILSVGIAYTLQIVCQRRCPPAPAAVIMSAEAIFAAVAGYFVLGQTLSLRATIGCGLIFAGILVVQLAPMMRRRAQPGS